MTSGAIYPGVPEVSLEFYSLNSFAIPRSVKCKYPKFSLNYTLVVKYKILRLNIAMNDVFAVYEFESLTNAGSKKSYLLLCEFVFLADMIS